MTVPTTTSSVIYTGTGSVSVYTFTWGIAQSADLIVYTISANGLVVTKLVETTDYTVAGEGFPTGGTVTLVAGNLATGVKLFIASDPEQIQDVLLQQGAAFNPADLMAALDLLTREVQANRRLLAGSLQFPVAESLGGLINVLPTAAARASGLLGFDASGNAVIGGGTSTVVISSAMTPVVQAATLALARAAMGLDAVYLALAGGTLTGPVHMGSQVLDGLAAPGSASAAATKAYVDAAVMGGAVLPIGCSVEWNAAAAPTGWFIEDGSAVSRTTYSGLFAVIGTTWGVGNGTTTFNIPDSRGRAAIGAGTGGGLSARTLAATGGEETHVLTVPEIPAHHHSHGFTGGGTVGAGGTGAEVNTGDTGGDGAHNNMQPFVVKNKIIRWSP